MNKFKEHLLSEKLITFAGKAYPKSGNVLIMAGGAGSGKGFILSKLVGLEGKVFDVDQLKKLAANATKMGYKIKKKYGIDIHIASRNLRDPKNVEMLHTVIKDYLDLPNKNANSFFKGAMSVSPKDKPNVIFDVTLKDLRKLQNITNQVKAMGYESDKIHIVWVVNDVEVAKSQNKNRSRVVPTEILVNTHRGVSHTMHDVLKMGAGLEKYMNGDIVLAFSKIGVDSNLVKSGKGGSYIKDANYVYVKRAGKPVTPFDQIDKDIKTKIASYVPKSIDWNK